ncbi:MAG: hypothetical protein ACRD98_07000 [Nitrososphaera sp.]
MTSDDYAELTLAEAAERMRCAGSTVLEREKSDEIFAIMAPTRFSGRRYPAFQFSSAVDLSLLKGLIAQYRHAAVPCNELWHFLRSTPRDFCGKTGVGILLGASVPTLEGLSVLERADAVLDVVKEELSRIAH